MIKKFWADALSGRVLYLAEYEPNDVLREAYISFMHDMKKLKDR